MQRADEFGSVNVDLSPFVVGGGGRRDRDLSSRRPGYVSSDLLTQHHETTVLKKKGQALGPGVHDAASFDLITLLRPQRNVSECRCTCSTGGLKAHLPLSADGFFLFLSPAPVFLFPPSPLQHE